MRVIFCIFLVCACTTHAAEAPVIVRCLEGNCLLRRSGHIYVEPFKGGQEKKAERGDTVMTVGVGSLLEVDFGERKGQAYLRDTALAQITQGSERIIVGAQAAINLSKTQARSNSSRTHTTDSDEPETVRVLPSVSAGNLSYFRDLAIDLVTPPPEGSLFLEKFPTMGKIVVRVSDVYLVDAFIERHSNWILRLEEDKEFEIPLKFQALEGSHTHFIAQVEWPRAGLYQLIPLGPTGNPTPDSAIEMRVSGPEVWGTEIDKLIEGARRNSDVQIEVETPSQ